MKQPAGYSGKRLVDKLGIKPGFRISFVNQPSHHLATLGPLPEGVKVLGIRGTNLNFLHLFARDRFQLIRTLPRAKPRIRADGMLWISWPKQTSRMASNLSETAVRELGLSIGLVDVKVAAIDDDWSALKFVYRLKDRR